MILKIVLSNILNIFLSPKEAYEKIREFPNLLLPLLILLIFHAVVLYLFIPIDLEAMKYFIKMDMADDHVAAWQNRMGESMQWRPLTTSIFSVVDLFAVWYLIVFFFGVQKIVPFSHQKSFVVSLVIWGLGIFFQVQLRIIGLSDYENLQGIL